MHILSGVFEGKTTGTPISLVIYNEDQKSKDYGDIKDKFRPGHADFTYFKNMEFEITECGGGRSSARETAARVAAGAIARKVLEHKLGKKFNIVGAVTQVGPVFSNPENWDDKQISKNPFFAADKDVVSIYEHYLMDIRKSGSSCGAMIELRARGIPVGLGAPIYSKLDADIAAGLMSINAVKSVNIGAGSEVASLSGELNSDEMRASGKQVKFKSNKAGGILGGISSGQEIICSFAVKPTSSILNTRETVNKKERIQKFL